MHTWQVSGIAFRRLNCNYARNGIRLRPFFASYKSFGKTSGHRVRLALWFREQNKQVAKECVRQFEFITAQRIRRGIQIVDLYTRIWDEVALKRLWQSWKSRIERNTRYFVVSAIGVTTYNWGNERITDDEVNSYTREIEGIHKLRESTVMCAKCCLRIAVDQPQAGIEYCSCDGATSNPDSEGWQPYIELQDMLVWRKQEPNSGLYAYKVYGSFPDVSAEDFLQVQIDVNYRKQWDATAEELRIIETDPEVEASKDRSTDIIYWKVIWPKLFSNRDYVYQRRWVVDRERKLIVIVSKVTKHPKVPNRPRTCRVTTYWSYMVIKPYTDLDQPGIEFCLTYFDDPGVNVLPNVVAWIAKSGVPQFLSSMRQASKDYQKYKTASRGETEAESGALSTSGRLPERLMPAEMEERVDKRADDGADEQGAAAGRLLRRDSKESRCSVNDVVLCPEMKTDRKGNNVEKDGSADEPKDFINEENHGILHHFSLSRLFA